MSFLLIGGTGKTATRLAMSLAAANKPFLLTSRHGPDASSHGYPAIKFDWTIESTWSKAFENDNLERIYMTPPPVDKPWVPMIKFVDLARQKGVRRFVLCAGTSAAIGKDGMGRVWEHLISCGVDYCVLRPCWFMGS
jgi:festuclavine dehydrogenase